MGFFTDLGTSLVGGALDLGGSWASNELIGRPNQKEAYKLADKNSARAFARSYGAFKRRYQDTVHDMRQAGLNPILAASGGMPAGNAVQISPANPAIPPNYDNSATAAGRNISQSTQAKAKAQESVANVFKIRAEEGLASAREREANANTFKLEGDLQRIGAEIDRLKQERIRIMNESSRTQADTERIEQLTKESKAKTKQIKAIYRQLMLEMNKLRMIAEVYKGPVGQEIAYINALMGRIGLGAFIKMPIPEFPGYGKHGRKRGKGR